MAKAQEVNRKWYVVDVEGKVLGRAASEVERSCAASINLSIHLMLIRRLCNCYQCCTKVVLTGKKLDKKLYRHHTGWIGNFKEIKYRHFLQQKPEKVFELAVKRMLPGNRLGRAMFRKLKVYAGSEHNHQARSQKCLSSTFNRGRIRING